MAKRVHNLAKELGVKSTAIVDKCQAEGLPIKNHMSTLSAGLEATIREWFSEGAHATTVETTAPVDLDKVREKRARKAQEALEAAAAAGIEQQEEEPEEAEAGEELVEAEPAAVEELVEPGVRPHRISPRELAETEGASEEQVEMASAESPTAPAEAEPAGPEPAEPLVEALEEEEMASAAEEASEDIVTEAPVEGPAGPRMAPGFRPKQQPKAAAAGPAAKSDQVKHVPKPAQLQGPNVVRVEQPEPATTWNRPRPAARRPIEPVVGPVVEGETTGKKGKRGKDRKHAVAETEAAPKAKLAKARTRRHRGGRGYEAPATYEPHQWGDRDWQERQERLAQAGSGQLAGRARRLADEQQRGGPARPAARVEKIVVKEPITVKELSAAIGVRTNQIIGYLMQMGTMATVNDNLDAEVAQALALEFGVELEVKEKKLLLDELQERFEQLDAESSQEDRGPVVAFLGHVDHGKTSLLDRIRQASVASGEAGGITQHIGSYVYDDGQRRVTFLDTPGHEAFTAMRARGANMTDIVVLVVAADDGVMPQTVEAINHARAANVPIVVAVNKIDLPGTDRNRVLGQLAEHKLMSADWGGDTEIVYTSAATGEGITDLIEHLDFVAEYNQLKARKEGPAMGWVIEAELTSGQGARATLLVKSGTLKPGDVMVSGASYGRVRTVTDATGRSMSEAGPASPVGVTGLDAVPQAGERFFIVEDISQAAEIAQEQASRRREKSLGQRRQVTLENLYSEIAAGSLRELNVIIKGDVQGSVDALRDAVVGLNTEEVAVRLLHAATGGISESDVLLAEASEAIVIGFQVVADDYARTLAEQKGVQIRTYRVIYDIIDDIHQALEGMLKPSKEERHLGRAEVRQTFKVSRIGVIAGCHVVDGTVPRSGKVRLVRDGTVLRDEMSIQSLKRGKDDASEVRSGFECGIKLANYDDLKVGDMIEAYEVVEVSRKLAGARQ